MIRLAGKLSLPLLPPVFGPAVTAARRVGLFSFSPDFRRLLRYGRGVDVSRLIEEVGFRPAFTMEEAALDYVATQQGRRLAPTVRQAVASR
jgi:UDP-glucose 4-epimerase